MGPRLNKRQQRELQELEELEKQRASEVVYASDDGEDETDHELETVGKAKPITSAFGALDLGEDDDQTEEPSEEEEVVVAKAKKNKKKKPKKKKAPAVADPDDPDSAASPSAPATPAHSSKPAKRPGTNTTTSAAKATADDGLDEIDRALAELAKKSGGVAAPTVASESAPGGRLEPKWQAVKDSFSFDQKFLDPEAELRKMFGSKVIASAPNAPRSQHHARLANNPHHATSLRRTPAYLATPEAGWQPPTGVIGIERYTGPEAAADPGGEWWTYSHPVSYKQAQLSFLEVLQQADGNKLYNTLQYCPYHIDTHMQLAEMQTQQGDLGAASTHLGRALYALSAPLPPSFPSGAFRLPYSQIENRAFFTGIARRVAIMVKRGTWRTACEWAKIGLGVGGGEDPVGMLCQLDFLGPKARQFEWFINLLDTLSTAYPDMRLSSYPGLAFAKALCLRGLENDGAKTTDSSPATEALKHAILKFPMVVTLLSNSLGSNLPPSFVRHKRAQPDGAFTDRASYMLSILSELYVARSSPLWKEPPVFEWLNKTVRSLADSLDDSTITAVSEGERLFDEGAWEKGTAPAGVIRAVFISEIPSVRPYLPPAATSGTTYSYDPLPPSGPNVTYYDDRYFAPLYAAGQGQGQGRGGRRRAGQAPTGAALAQMNQLRQQLAAMLGMGEEGGAMALNEDLRRELMEDLERLQAGGGGGVPGGFPGEEEEEDEGEWDDEDGEGEGEGGGDGLAEEGPGGGGFVERLMALLPGRGPGAQQE